MTFIGPMSVVLELLLHLLGRQLFEEAGVEVAGVVDQDVDVTEAVDGRLDGGLGLARLRDVEAHDEEVVGLAKGLRHRFRVAPVATTALPAARAAFAMSTPMPRPAPVMNQTFPFVMSHHLPW